jgi:peptidoglycan/xylan/chitin deacetylase (PgdA/CDA1 family)
MARPLPDTGGVAHLATVDLDSAAPSGDEFLSRLVGSLQAANTHATFFVELGRCGTSTRTLARIAGAGHEIGLLGTTDLDIPYNPDFRDGLQRARQMFEAATGQRLRGYRHHAPVDDSKRWMLDVLLDEGFEYDSSWRPSEDSHSSVPAFARQVHSICRWGGVLVEIPTRTSELAPLPFGLASIRTMRAVPLPILRRALLDRERSGATSMLHLKESRLRTLSPGARQSGSEHRTLSKLERLLLAVRFTAVTPALAELARRAPVIEN